MYILREYSHITLQNSVKIPSKPFTETLLQLSSLERASLGT